MNISIDARGINLYKGSGIGTYTENLLKELLNIEVNPNGINSSTINVNIIPAKTMLFKIFELRDLFMYYYLRFLFYNIF